MPGSAILVTSYDPGYLTITESLVRSERAAGNVPVVIDVSALLAAPTDSYHRGTLHLFGLQHPGHDLRERVVEAGGEFLAGDELGSPGDDALLDPELESALDSAVRSGLITFARTDRPDPHSRWVRAVTAGLRTEGRRVYRAVRSVCATRPGLAVAYVPNGRFPHQRLAALAFRESGVPVRHVEKGESADRAFVQEYSPHDRFTSQGSVDAVLTGLSASEIDEIADGWLARRAPARDSGNEYSALWNGSVPRQIRRWRDTGERVAGFFTSSQDEFQFQGPEWQVHEWADQFEAFDAILTRFEQRGFRSFLRVHPNLATRAHDTFRRELDGIRHLKRAHPGLEIIWHDSPANSYALLEASTVVVTFASTIGVEASALGIPVWTAAATRFGMVADVHELFSAADVERDGMRPWTVDRHRAKRFIAYLVRRDTPVTPPSRPWTSWGARRPLGAKLAAMAVSGGTPGVGAAVLSLVDIYRHRNPAANGRALRRRDGASGRPGRAQ
jgi:hypothetical protein